MNLPLNIAGRYLFARKSHNVINVISAISMIGMALGTAALILILSVYNGFDRLIKDNLSDIDPDLRIVPQSGKYFVPSGQLLDFLESKGKVEAVIEDNVFFLYGNEQGIAKARGVRDSYLESSGLSEHIIEGELKLGFGDIDCASVGSGIAYSHAIHPRFVDLMTVYYPDRTGKFSPANPTASLKSVKVKPSSIFSISTDTDNELMFLPYAAMQKLLGYEEEVSSLELRTPPGASLRIKEIQQAAGEDLVVLDRFHQHPTLFKMMRYEKAAVFLILIFVVIIVAFNIFGSLSMLIIEKREDISTLQAMGADDRTIRKVFVLEGWMISLVGLAVGLAAGIILTLVQQHFGIVKLPGNYLIEAYPVALEALDVVLASVGVAAIGFVIARLSART